MGDPILWLMTTRAFTDDEVRSLAATLFERRRYRDRLFLVMAVGTGFRASELLSLGWSQLLTPAGQIAREVTIARANLKGGAGLRRKSGRAACR